MNQTAIARPTRRRRERRVAGEPGRVTARVTVAWTPSNHDGEPGPFPTEIELVALEADPSRAWTYTQNCGMDWFDALSSAPCREVVLTARLSNNLSAKHLVLELAELLTISLTKGQPLIRVRFLPTASTNLIHG